MVDFDKLLADSLVQANEGIGKAGTDLHELVVRASEALEKRSNGRLRLRLREDDIRNDGTLYRLAMVVGPEAPVTPETRRLYDLFVPTSGYPIREVLDVFPLGDRYGQELADRGALEEFLAALFSSPQSPVVQMLAWILRHPQYANDP
jgi:hypothetical protein